MENASQALIIAGAILLAILIIAIGMYIYNSAQSTITESLTDMSTQQIDAFNSSYESYKGKQTGSQISAMAGRLIANANTYKDEPAKLPQVVCEKLVANGSVSNIDVNGSNDGNQQNYIDTLAVIKNKVENKHSYTVELGYGTSGLINKITIIY